MKQTPMGRAFSEALGLIALSSKETQKPVKTNKGSSAERLEAQRRVERMQGIFGSNLDQKIDLSKAEILLHNDAIDQKRKRK